MRPTSQRPSEIEAFQAVDHWARGSPGSLLALRYCRPRCDVATRVSEAPPERAPSWVSCKLDWMVNLPPTTTTDPVFVNKRKLYTASRDLHRVGRAARLGIPFSRYPRWTGSARSLPSIDREHWPITFDFVDSERRSTAFRAMVKEAAVSLFYVMRELEE